jgi:hypothetical protein
MKTVYIDDDDRELQKYKSIFETHGNSRDKFEIIPIKAQKGFEQLIKEVKSENPQLILIDLKLEKPSESGKVFETSGAPLSTAFKELFPDIPIVLFTKQDLFGEKIYPNQVLLSADTIIYKSDIFKAEGEVLNFLYNFAKGFETLRDIHPKEWDEVLKTIQAPEDNKDFLKLSRPPNSFVKRWSVSEIANWIVNVLIKYPGILYDSVHAATFLGISEEDFKSDDFQIFFISAKYSGAFEPTEGRWWKSKLQELAESIMNEEEKNLLIREGFSLVWERVKGAKPQVSKCVYSGEFPADWVCYVLKKPVMIKYSLSYKPDSRPYVMDEARVSFEAIRSGDEVDEELLDPLELEIFNEIRNKGEGKY